MTLLFACGAMVACVTKEPEYVDFSAYQTYSNAFVPVSETASDVRNEKPWENIYGDWQPVEKQQDREHGNMQKTSPLAMTDLARGLLEVAMTTKVHQVAGTYRSVDIHGDSLTVSGKFFYPESGVIRNLMLVSHYTIGANHEAPSQTFSFEGLFAALGYGVIMADYVGFGVTADMVHPYLQAYTTAHNVIDMALAVRPFIAERGLKVESDSLILWGYSQGGATTMHVQRVLENDPDYVGKFKIKHNYAGAGPYDIAKTYDYCVETGETGIPCAMPMIIQGMSIGMEKPLNMEYFFQEPLLSNYHDWINSKQYTVNQMSTLIGETNVHKLLTEDACNKQKVETARFYMELFQNSIPSSFVPKAPVYMFHSMDDRTVPFINSQLMHAQFDMAIADEVKCGEVEYDFGHYGDHMKGAITFIQKTIKLLK